MRIKRTPGLLAAIAPEPLLERSCPPIQSAEKLDVSNKTSIKCAA